METVLVEYSYKAEEKKSDEYVVALERDDPLDVMSLYLMANTLRTANRLGKRLVLFETEKSIEEIKDVVDLFLIRISYKSAGWTPDKMYEGIPIDYFFDDDTKPEILNKIVEYFLRKNPIRIMK